MPIYAYLVRRLTEKLTLYEKEYADILNQLLAIH